MSEAGPLSSLAASKPRFVVPPHAKEEEENDSLSYYRVLLSGGASFFVAAKGENDQAVSELLADARKHDAMIVWEDGRITVARAIVDMEPIINVEGIPMEVRVRSGEVGLDGDMEVAAEPTPPAAPASPAAPDIEVQL
jgi:hypothetical protein